MGTDIDLGFQPGTEAPPVRRADVARLEEMLGLELDRGYLEFLGRHNGGAVRRNRFDLRGDTKVVERFLCVTPDYADNPRFGRYDVGVVWSQIEGRLNDFLVPVAALYPGDFLCLDYERGTPGRVVLWNHELSEENAPHLTPVADNFEEFLKLLY